MWVTAGTASTLACQTSKAAACICGSGNAETAATAPPHHVLKVLGPELDGMQSFVTVREGGQHQHTAGLVCPVT